MADCHSGLENLNKPEAPQDAKLDPATRAQREAFFKLLLENVHLENGAFHLDGHGKLCGTQFVTVARFSYVVAFKEIEPPRHQITFCLVYRVRRYARQIESWRFLGVFVSWW